MTPRVYSNKTRIKTATTLCWILSSKAPRVYSNKTRIKTSYRRLIWAALQFLREYIPTKQGLRQGVYCLFHIHFISPRVYSNKTRIKTYWKRAWRFIISPRVYSNKTRIKTLSCKRHFWFNHLREYIPTKQWLRPTYVSKRTTSSRPPRVYSNKTRIKTP